MELFSFFNGFDGWNGLEYVALYGQRLLNWAGLQYQEAPALVFAVCVALVVPALAVVGVLIRFLDRFRVRPTPRVRTVRTRPGSFWRRHATLEFANSNADGFRIDRGIVRIGREADNDLCLLDPTVHRYHAILEQTPDAEYVISYVGDPDRDGLIINGRAVDRQRLSGGDVLEIGTVKLRFALSSA